MKIIVIIFSTILLGSNLVKALESPIDVTWGGETNQVKAGIFNSASNFSEKRADFEIWLQNSANATLPFIVPESPFQFDLVVFDEEGKAVLKTERGQKLGQMLPQVIEVKGQIEGPIKVYRVYLQPNEPELLLHKNFNLFDYFQITKPGKYRVEFEERLQVALTATSFQRLVLPKVIRTLEIK